MLGLDRSRARARLLEVGQDLGDAEQAHHDRHQADAVEQLEPVEGEPRLRRDRVHADEAEHEADAGHQQRLGHRALASGSSGW